jgi:hypothetical protein
VKHKKERSMHKTAPPRKSARHRQLIDVAQSCDGSLFLTFLSSSPLYSVQSVKQNLPTLLLMLLSLMLSTRVAQFLSSTSKSTPLTGSRPGSRSITQLGMDCHTRLTLPPVLSAGSTKLRAIFTLRCGAPPAKGRKLGKTAV